MRNSIAALLCVGALLGPPGCGDDTTMDPADDGQGKLTASLTPQAMILTVGETMSLMLNVENAPDFHVATFHVAFPETLLTLDDVRESRAFLGPGGLLVHSPTATGISVGVGRTAGAEPGDFPADGVLIELEFTSTGVGTGWVAFDDLLILDRRGQPLKGSEQPIDLRIPVEVVRAEQR